MNYIITIVLSLIAGIVSSIIYVFFFMIDKDEEEYYAERGEEIPFEDIRRGTSMSPHNHEFEPALIIVYGIPYGIVWVIIDCLGFQSKLISLLIAVLMVIFSLLSTLFVKKIYYWLKNHNYLNKPEE
ncbi:MAG: hypothetical protein E7574_03715 [Ruminococcaceae bacterium]|nr:hypothetical protein [Oscillospiraceae bacterium]